MKFVNQNLSQKSNLVENKLTINEKVCLKNENILNSYLNLSKKYEKSLKEKRRLDTQLKESNSEIKKLELKNDKLEKYIENLNNENGVLKEKNNKLVEKLSEKEQIIKSNHKEFEIDLQMFEKLHKKLNKKKSLIFSKNDCINKLEKNEITLQNFIKYLKNQLSEKDQKNLENISNYEKKITKINYDLKKINSQKKNDKIENQNLLEELQNMKQEFLRNKFKENDFENQLVKIMDPISQKKTLKFEEEETDLLNTINRQLFKQESLINYYNQN